MSLVRRPAAGPWPGWRIPVRGSPSPCAARVTRVRLACRPFIHIRRRLVVHHPPVGQDGTRSPSAIALSRLCRGHDDRAPRVGAVGDQRVQQGQRLLVEAAVRLVHEKHGGIVQQRAGDAEPPSSSRETWRRISGRALPTCPQARQHARCAHRCGQDRTSGR